MNNLNENYNQIEQSINSNIKLYEHQKTILYAIKDLEKTHLIKLNNNAFIETNIAILSDKVGSGKTYDIIYLIENLPNPTQYKKFTSYELTEYINIYFDEKVKNENNNLIIVPHILIPQWINVIKLTKLKYIKLRYLSDFKNLKYNKISSNDIILLSSKMINKFCSEVTGNWNRIIIDEPHIYPINLFGLKSNFMWLLCATPNELFLSNKTFFKDIIGKRNCNSIPWNYKNMICIQNEYKYIDKSIILPKINYIDINCLTPSFLGYFRNSIPSNAIDLLNAGQIKDAIKLLNCNSDTSDNIIQTLTKLYETKLFNIERRIVYLNELVYNNETDKKERLKPVYEEKSNVENKIKGIKERLLKFNCENCPICLDQFNTPVASKCCSNIFCMECLLKCMKNKSICPFCRAHIKPSDLHVINNNIKNEIKKDKKLSKKDELLKILKNSDSSQKFLICSKYDQVFFEISKELDDNNISYKILNGSAQRVLNIIKEYENGKLKVILLNSHNFGSGLNLQMTTDIIIYHKLGQSMEDQVIGRAQRIGRKQSLRVTYLKYNNEYEKI